jgi:site-specific DNA-methyltransferase (adenine-specific)
MKRLNEGKQMKDVWRLPAIAKWEKACGKHPTQKPLALLARIILASTQKGAWVLDPFTGSSTTGIAANLLDRRFLGIDQDASFLDISRARKEEIEDILLRERIMSKLNIINIEAQIESTTCLGGVTESQPEYFLNDIDSIT